MIKQDNKTYGEVEKMKKVKLLIVVTILGCLFLCGCEKNKNTTKYENN